MPTHDTVVVLDDTLWVVERHCEIIADAARTARIDVIPFTSDADARRFVRSDPSRIRGFIQDLNRDVSTTFGSASSHGVRFLEEIIVPLTPWARTTVCSGYGTYEAAVRVFEAAKGQVRFLDKFHFDDAALLEAFLWIIESRDLAEPAEPTSSATTWNAPIIRVLDPAWNEVCSVIAAEPKRLHQVDPRLFERLIAEIFKSYGCDVELTAATRDGGYDIIAVRLNAPTSTRILVEAKRFAPNRPVGVEIVRSLYGIRSLNSVSQVVLATSSYVSGPAKREFERVVPWEIDFLERDRIVDWCGRYGGVNLSGTFSGGRGV